MAEIVISIVVKVAEYLVKPAIHEGQCFICVNKVIKDFENEKEELASERDNLQNRVKQAKERTEVIEEPVEKWLSDVQNLLEEVMDLEQRMKANTSCFQGQCPTWRRYRLCKQMEEKIEAMRNFKGKSNIQPFSHRAPLPGIQYPSSENFTYFESTKVAYNQLLEALQDDGIYMIGVYGMGGSGKTTLVTEAGKKADELNLFDKVISITVSQTLNIKDIQGQMADMLNLKLEEESEEGRAQRLWLSLREKKRILVIVDDLWRKFNLEDIGIRVDKGMWKVLITTRDEHVCDSMDSQKKIHLGLLSEDESWNLFQKRANIDDGFSKSLDDVPRKICYECKGLLIAIVAVGSSLKGKSNADWKMALNSLKHSEAINDHVEEGVRTALSCLKLSYDYLQNIEAKLLFLMCSMFLEDYSISIEDLIQYAVGVGQGGTFSLSLARDVIEANINKLLQSCLLMQAEKHKGYVKMHDMIRDAALWISKRSENHKILVNLHKPLSVLVEDDTIRDCFAVSSWYDENEFFCQLLTPNIEILLLNMQNFYSLEFSNAIFEGIQGLKVFSVINNIIHIGRPLLSLPQSTQLLTNLQTLRLNQWELGDISFIASLTRLVVLDLRDCSFNEIPNEIGNLKRLKLLDLSECDIRENYNGAIGKCSQLEELYFSRDFLLEYCCQSIVDIITLPKLQRFVITTAYIHKEQSIERGRFLALADFNISNLSTSKKNILQIAETIHLECLHGGCKNITPDMVGVVGGMDGLTSLLLLDCQEIECIFNTTSDSKVDALIPRLVELELHKMKNLKELCQGSPLQVLHFFEKLEKLQILNCPQLHSVFPRECNLRNLKILIMINNDYCDGHNGTLGEVLILTSVAQSLQQLEKLKIEGFDELQHIIASETEHGSNTSEEIVPAPSSSHFVMSSLKEVDIRECRKLESIFQICCVEGLIKLPHLEDIKLRRLENLVRICPESCGVNWPSLKETDVEDCPKLSASWIIMMAGSEQRQQHLNEQKHLPSTLQRLKLQGLPQLDLIPWMGPTPRQILSLQCLQHLHIIKCENLKFLLSMEAPRSLPMLIVLEIKNCQELEQIIAENEELVQLHDAEVYFPKLKHIRVSNCNKLKSLFSVAMVRMLPQLSTLSIARATQLKEVFRHCNGDNTIDEMEIVLPDLTMLELYKLPSFVDICQGYRLRAVKLQELRVVECPKTAPSLRAIQVTRLPNQQGVLTQSLSIILTFS